jgi:hypothetical protein
VDRMTEVDDSPAKGSGSRAVARAPSRALVRLGEHAELLLRANFSDHHPRPWWLEHFPRGFEVDASLFQPLHEVIAMFSSAGWRVASFGTVTEPSSGTRGDMLERPFYTHPQPGDGRWSNSFDLLFRGLELVTGGQCLHRHSDYLAAIQARGEDPAAYSDYLEAFAHGMHRMAGSRSGWNGGPPA